MFDFMIKICFFLWIKSLKIDDKQFYGLKLFFINHHKNTSFTYFYFSDIFMINSFIFFKGMEFDDNEKSNNIQMEKCELKDSKNFIDLSDENITKDNQELNEKQLLALEKVLNGESIFIGGAAGKI